MFKTRLFDATTTTIFTYLLQTCWCLQMLIPQQSAQVRRYLWISQMLLPRQSLQQLLTRWCSQMSLSSHCLQELLFCDSAVATIPVQVTSALDLVLAQVQGLAGLLGCSAAGWSTGAAGLRPC